MYCPTKSFTLDKHHVFFDINYCLVFQSDVGVYTCEASNEMGKMFAVLNVPDHADLPDLVSEGEDGVTATGSEMKQRKVKSGAVMIRSETVIFIFMALAVHLRTRY